MTDDDQHVKENFGTGLDEVRCPNTIMSTWRYCPYCGENIEDCPHERVDGAVETGTDSVQDSALAEKGETLPDGREPEESGCRAGSARSTDAPNDADDVDPAGWRFTLPSGTTYIAEHPKHTPENLDKEREPLFTAGQHIDLLNEIIEHIDANICGEDDCHTDTGLMLARRIVEQRKKRLSEVADR